MKINFNKYGWLLQLNGLPPLIVELIRLGKLDTNEIPGPKSNVEIMKLAKIAGVDSFYKNDDTAWCALCMCAMIITVGYTLLLKGWDRLRAKAFLKCGYTRIAVEDAILGDLLVFDRNGGGHIGAYIAENKLNFHTGGGNQGNQVSIVEIPKSRCIGAFRPPYPGGVLPAACKKYFQESTGTVSTNEA